MTSSSIKYGKSINGEVTKYVLVQTFCPPSSSPVFHSYQTNSTTRVFTSLSLFISLFSQRFLYTSLLQCPSVKEAWVQNLGAGLPLWSTRETSRLRISTINTAIPIWLPCPAKNQICTSLTPETVRVRQAWACSTRTAKPLFTTLSNILGPSKIHI